MWATLSLDLRLGIDHLQLLGDSKTVVDWLNYKSNLQVISLMGWMEKIRDLIALFNATRLTTSTRKRMWKHIYFQKKHSRFWKGGSTSTSARMAKMAPHYHFVSTYDLDSFW